MDKRPRFKTSFRESWSRYAPAIVVLVLISVLAAIGSWYAGSQDRAVAQERFMVTASEALADLEDEIIERKTDADSLAHSYVVAIEEDRTDRREYQPRLNLLFSHIAGSQDLARADIILKVAASDRIAFESALSAATGAPVQITSLDEAGRITRAADSTEYYPVVFIEPASLTGQYIGRNAKSSVDLAAAIKQATLSGKPAVTGPISGFSGTGGGEGYAVAAPIYAPGTISPESKSGSSPPMGFAVGYQLYEKLLGKSGSEESAANIFLYDSASLSPDKPVAENLAAGHEAGDPRLSLQSIDGISQVITVNQNGRLWQIVASPSEPFAMGLLFWYALASSILLSGLVGVYLISSVRQTLELEGAEAALTESNKQLITAAEASERRARELTLLADISAKLQTLQTSNEVVEAIQIVLPKLFYDLSGALYFLNERRDTAEAKTVWGEELPAKTFGRDACVALRRSGAHRYSRDRDDVQCGHVGDLQPGSHICAPMLAEGQPFGMLYLYSPKENSDATYDMAQTVAEHLALAITNIELRATLKEQAVTDPLTSLFNRRFMENLFEREIRRADRAKAKIGVIMMDIDHFKEVNDKYGHAAGDMVLETLGIFLKTSVRMEDYVCRYGGEEFLVVIPGSNKKNTLQRAKDFKERAGNIEYLYKGANIGPITLSGGVSVYPDDGADKSSVIDAADTALYAAKEAGRNCVKEAETLKS